MILDNNLIYSTGTALLLSNIALNHNFLPFYVIHKYSFYNPHPQDNSTGVREIDRGTKTPGIERIQSIFDLMQANKEYFRIQYDYLITCLETGR